MNPTAAKFDYPKTLVAEWPHWAVLLRPAQVTLGSLVLVCRDPVQRFDKINYLALGHSLARAKSPVAARP